MNANPPKLTLQVRALARFQISQPHQFATAKDIHYTAKSFKITDASLKDKDVGCADNSTGVSTGSTVA